MYERDRVGTSKCIFGWDIPLRVSLYLSVHFLAMCQITHAAPSGCFTAQTPPSLSALSGSLQPALCCCSSPPHRPARSRSFSPVTERTLSLIACSLAALLLSLQPLWTFLPPVLVGEFSFLFSSFFLAGLSFPLHIFILQWISAAGWLLSCESLPELLHAVLPARPKSL